MNDIASSPVLWLPYLFCLGLAVGIACVVGHHWKSKLSGDQGKSESVLSYQAFSAASTTGVTVSGILSPILASLILFAVRETTGVTFAAYLLAGALALVTSTAVGIWLIFSLATAVKGDAGGSALVVTADRHTFYPALLVAQLILLVGGLVLISCFAPVGGILFAPAEVSGAG